MKYYSLVLILFFSTYCLSFEKKEYSFSHEPIDIVIPCHKKDCRTLEMVIEGAKKNIDHRRIIVISEQQFTDNAEWFDEKLFPFDKSAIAREIFYGNNQKAEEYLNSPRSRIGWIYQQFLKLYAMLVIPDISSNVLIIDADTIFLRPVTFQDEHGAGLFNPGTEYWVPYFEHASKALPGFKKMFANYSGISHHMLFQRSILENFFRTIKDMHMTEPWKLLARYINPSEKSSISEYELYFNFAFATSDQVKIRLLKWANIYNFYQIEQYKKAGYDVVSWHCWT